MHKAHLDRQEINPRRGEPAALRRKGLVDMAGHRIPRRGEARKLMLGYRVRTCAQDGAKDHVLEKNVVHVPPSPCRAFMITWSCYLIAALIAAGSAYARPLP